MANALIGNIEPYTIGNDINNYLARLEAFFELNDISVVKKTAHLLIIGGPVLFDLALKLCSPKCPKTVPYDILSRVLREHLQPIVNVVVERYKFRSLHQQLDESIAEYVVKLQTAALGCDFGTFLEEALRDQLVAGVVDAELRQRLLSEPFLTYWSACCIAQAWDVVKR